MFDFDYLLQMPYALNIELRITVVFVQLYSPVSLFKLGAVDLCCS